MTLNVTGLEDALKELYPNGIDESLIMKDHVLLPMLQRRRDFGGRYLHIPLRTRGVRGFSATFSHAQANTQASSFNAFQVTRAKSFGVGIIDDEAVECGKQGDASIFIDAVEAEVGSALAGLGDKLAWQVYRGTSGSFAQVLTGTASPITIDPDATYYLEVGDSFTANDTDNTTTPRSGTGVVTKINRDDGTVTFSGTITDLAVADYLFIEGDEGLAPAGLAAWVPATAPDNTSYFGCTVRDTDPEKYAGIRFDGSSFDTEEIFIRARARARRSNCKPDYYFTHPNTLADVATALVSQKQTVDSDVYDMSFEVINAPGGVKLVEDPDCPEGISYGITMDAFGWATLGDAPSMVKGDGLEMIRSATTMDYELRVKAYHNWWSDAPGKIIRVAH
jgi:hypothetical protein